MTMNIEEKKKLLEGFCENRDDCVNCPLKDTDIDCINFFECSDDAVEKAYNLAFRCEQPKDMVNCKNCLHSNCDENELPCGKCFNYDQWKPKEEINHPDRYAGGKYECIKVMVDVFGADAVKHFCILNAFKYVWRFEHKNGVEDIKKAIWYLNEYVKLDEGYYDDLGGDENA